MSVGHSRVEQWTPFSKSIHIVDYPETSKILHNHKPPHSEWLFLYEMSFLTVQVGQCGNQLGPCFFDILASEYASPSGCFYESSPWNPFFRLPSQERREHGKKPIARSILVDMEPSVVEAAFTTSQRKSSCWEYSRHNCYLQQSGSGNNWAMGYLEHGPRVRDSILECIRKELEVTDVFGGFLLLHSMAGGTGSGLGAYLTNQLGDIFPKSFLLNFSVWPYRIGEVTVQSYNAVLTLAHIMEFSHGIFLAENEALSAICQTAHRQKHPRMEDMNRHAMQGLAAALLPSKIRPIQGQSPTKCTPGSWTRTVSDFISVLCPRPCQSLLDCTFFPQIHGQSMDYATFDWEVLTRLVPMCKKPRVREKTTGHSFSHFITLRGQDSISPDMRAFSQDNLFTQGLARVGVAYSPVKFGGLEKSLSFVSNEQRNILPVIDSLSKAKKMFKSRAFLHSYHTYGLDAASFDNAFRFVEDHVISEYTVNP